METRCQRAVRFNPTFALPFISRRKSHVLKSAMQKLGNPTGQSPVVRGTDFSIEKSGFKVLSGFVAGIFSLQTIFMPGVSQAQSVNLPAPGTMVGVSEAFAPALIKGMTINLKDPFQLDFVVHPGDDFLSQSEFSDETQKLVKYFLAALTVPEDQLWVNLSPYEKDRMIPEYLGQTEMGREMLAQDYMLKQLTASLMYPDGEVGKEFWNKVYAKAAELGITNVPQDTFNKVWIIPGEIKVYEHQNHAFIVKNTLKVMLEEDYMAREAAVVSQQAQSGDQNAYMKDVVREVIIPVIEQEVNEGKNFASLRQIFNAMLMAAWYKKRLKESVLGQLVADQNKVEGINTVPLQATEAIWNQYVEAFQVGAYDYIKEDFDPASGEMIPKKYFSGGEVGIKVADIPDASGTFDAAALDGSFRAQVNLAGSQADDAQLNLASNVNELLANIEDVVVINPNIEDVQILDIDKLREETIDYLAQEASINPNKDIKVLAQKIIRRTANNLGIKSGTIHDFYTARNEGKWDGLTTPAYNVRTGPVYETMRQIIRSVNDQKVGPFVFELAASERRYTGQSFSEYTANGYAAAIKEGYKGFLFFRFDHLQLKKSEVMGDLEEDKIDYKIAIGKITKVMHEAVEAGVYLIDLDPSTVVDDRYLEMILPIEFDVTTKHIQQRMAVDAEFRKTIEDAGGIVAEYEDFDKDKPFDRESPVVRDIRRSLINHLEVGDLEGYYDNILAKVDKYKEEFRTRGLTEDKYLQNGLLTPKDIEYLRQFPMDSKTKEKLIEYYTKMHRLNYEITVGLLKYAREVLEPAYGLKDKGITLSMGIEVMHVDNPTHAKFPSTVLGALVLMKEVNEWSDDNNYARPSTLSLQSGTQHGLGGDAYWGIYVAHEAARQALGVGTFSQHGTSTIDLDKFWNMPYMGSGDAHLATEYQKIAFGIIARNDADIRTMMQAYMEALIYSDWTEADLENKFGKPVADAVVAKLKAEKLWDAAKREADYSKFRSKYEAVFKDLKALDWADGDIVSVILGDDVEDYVAKEQRTKALSKGYLKDLTKELSSPFKVEIWGVSADIRRQLDDRLYREFSTIHRELNLENTENLLPDLGYAIQAYAEPFDAQYFWPNGVPGLQGTAASYATEISVLESENGGIIDGFFNTEIIEELIEDNKSGEIVDQADEAMLLELGFETEELTSYADVAGDDGVTADNAPLVDWNRGGIDFNASGVNMEIQMSEDGFAFPDVDPAMLQNIRFNGWNPQIINIQKLEMPMIRQMLGMEPNTGAEADISFVPSQKAIRAEDVYSS